MVIDFDLYRIEEDWPDESDEQDGSDLNDAWHDHICTVCGGWWGCNDPECVVAIDDVCAECLDNIRDLYS